MSNARKAVNSEIIYRYILVIWLILGYIWTVRLSFIPYNENNIWIETDGKSKFINILYNWFEPQLKAAKELYEIEINTVDSETTNQTDITKEENKLIKDSEKILAKYDRAILRSQTSKWLENIIKCIICDIRDDLAFSKFNNNNNKNNKRN